MRKCFKLSIMVMALFAISASQLCAAPLDIVPADKLAGMVKDASGLELAVSGESVTREQAAVAVAGALGIKTPSESVCADVAGLGEASRAAVAATLEAGVLKIYADKSFHPADKLTYADAEEIARRLAAIVSKDYFKGTVQTISTGRVVGVERKEDGAYVWLGVPYGKSPTGELRWHRPQLADPWEGTFVAQTPGPYSIQAQGGKIVGSEDCMNMDIYRPNTNATGLPVHIFIHGGNNQTGTSAQIDGGPMAARENCIVISSNYRIGPFGFNCLPALRNGDPLEDSGNYTLLDIAMSLDWIRDNIASFGGDGTNITVSGLSSGGRDVMAMLLSPLFKGKMQRAVSFSGGMTTSDPEKAVVVYARAFAKLAVEDGKKADEKAAEEWLLTDAADVREWLYGLAADRVAGLMTGASIRMAPFPHLFEDGVVLPKGGFASNSYANPVPLMMFAASNEFTLFGLGAEHISARVADGSVLTDPASRAEAEFICRYGSMLYGLFNAEESAERMFDHYPEDIYTCWIAWGNDPKIVGEEMALLSGSYHGMSQPMMSGRAEPNYRWKEPFSTDGFKDMSRKFQAYMGNFMRTGDPNGSGLVRWEKWTSANGGTTHLVFDADMDSAKIKMTKDRIYYGSVLTMIEEDKSIPDETKDTIVRTNFNGRWFSERLDKHFGNPSLWPK